MAATRTAPEHLWFLDTWVSIRIAAKDGADGMSLLDHRAPSGDSPPLHVHHTEDEVFVVLEGELTFRVRDDELRLRPGETLLALKGIPHTYRVDSPSDGRWMTVTARGDFERLIRELGRPAERLELPPPSVASVGRGRRGAGRGGAQARHRDRRAAVAAAGLNRLFTRSGRTVRPSGSAQPA